MINNVAVLTIQYIDLEVVINVSTYMCTHTYAHMSVYIHTHTESSEILKCLYAWPCDLFHMIYT